MINQDCRRVFMKLRRRERADHQRLERVGVRDAPPRVRETRPELRNITQLRTLEAEVPRGGSDSERLVALAAGDHLLCALKDSLTTSSSACCKINRAPRRPILHRSCFNTDQRFIGLCAT